MIASHSPNLSEELKQKLQALVPEAFKDGQLDVEALKRLLGSETELRDESYVLNWLGKSYARLLANENARTWLRADDEHNAQPGNTNSQNLLIKGDNLEVLKHLVGAYEEKIKMIYIDPPYNTGSDGFVYADDRKFTVKQLSRLAGIDEDEAKRILEFTKAKSNSHSAWLTFMYPRLYIAKQLLRDDGVIFISIDDNEQAQLKLLCDDVFGEENFVAQFSRVTKRGGKSTDTVSKNHDLIYCYSKSNAPVFYPFKHNDKDFKHKDEFFETRGFYKLNQTLDYDTLGYVNSLDYEIGIGGVSYYAGSVTKAEFLQRKIEDPKDGYRWRWSKDMFDFGFKNGFVVVKKSKKSVRIYTKTYQLASIEDDGDYYINYENRTKALSSIEFLDNVYSNDNAKKDVKKLLGKAIFDYPKPYSLVAKLANFSTKNKDIILDFFAGSGTAAHAVMQLNAEDGGNRKFICVQLDEDTDHKSEAYKAGYKTIFDITKARIEKAATKIKAENPEHQADLGFKVFETVSIPDKYQETPEDLTENLELFDAEKLTQTDRQSLMRTWALQDNVPLTLDLVPVDLAGYTAYQAGHILYFIEPNISLDAVVKLLEQLDNNPDFTPSRLVVLGYLLESKIQREMTEAVKHYNNRKGIELTLDVRY